MFNRPTSLFSDDPPVENTGVDRSPQRRLALLWVIMLVPVVAIWARTAQLQLQLQEAYVAGLTTTTESYEEIPARDGRISAADGTLLASDVEQYSVSVHYAALQDPPDDEWVTARARQRLRKSDRRDKERLASEKEKVLAEHDQFWQRLSDLTGESREQLQRSRHTVQDRVHQIKASVLRRFQERQSNSDIALDRDESTLWSTAVKRLQRAFTEPPVRSHGPRLISEELDYHVLIPQVTSDVRDEIEAHPQRFPFARVIVHSQRRYPQGELACHLVGVRKPLSEEDLQERKQRFPDGDPLDYHVQDPCGRFGLERSYDAQLKGVRGRRKIVKNRRGEIVDSEIVREPRHGRDLNLTLDPQLQRRAEQLLDEALTKVTLPGQQDADSMGVHRQPSCPQGGAIVALDIHTGAVLAAASAPRFDLNLLVRPDAAGWDDVVSDPRSPFVSRVTQMALPPGSVFKVISAVATIESGAFQPDEHFACRGYLDRPDQYRCLPFRHNGVGHYDVTLEDALCRSCNVYFFSAARKMGSQTLVDWTRQFGIGRKTGIDLPDEAAGHIPTASPQRMSTGERRLALKPADTLGMAIGQSSLTVTPLQMARVMAAIANGGDLVTPHLGGGTGPSSITDERSMHEMLVAPESQRIPGLHPETLESIHRGLTMVVHDSRGTGYKTVRRRDVTIAGKTGTAETGNGNDHAWFAGYVPAEQPRVAFVVVLQHGGSGGKAAGPVAHDFVQALLDAQRVTSDANLAQHRHTQNRTSAADDH